MNQNKNKMYSHIYRRQSPKLLVSTLFSGVLIASAQAAVTEIGQGSYADRANPLGYTCSIDYGSWIHNAGVVEPGIAGCDEVNGPIGEPTPLYPQLTGPAEMAHTGTHRWWGSVAFYGEMPVGDTSRAAFITPDPIAARISDRGFRMLNIPGGMEFTQDHKYLYEVPDPFTEVFDGLAIANSQYTAMDAFLYDYSDGSVTVEWQQGGNAIMRATFVHGSPYVFIDVLRGELVLKSKAQNGPEKDIYFQQDNMLGLWTDVASKRATYLVIGDGATSFGAVESNTMSVSNASGRVTIAMMPTVDDIPDAAMIDAVAAYALNQIDEVRIDYSVDRATNDVTVTHNYLNNGAPVETLAGLLPMAWKNAVSPLDSDYQVRSARGITKFTAASDFSYELPFVGLLPSLPALDNAYDEQTLRSLIQDVVNMGDAVFNEKQDTYWAGKDYGKLAELAALAYEHGFTEEHAALTQTLKTELENWFKAETNGQPDVNKYFSYDTEWNTMLGYEESFGAQQQLNDHHFHYGYFVRAAAEICRTDKDWCAPENYGGMVELLIRDYAADRDDSMFPYTRNFDPANGFSWASGHANFALGNNNESTSEAANAYGAIVLYGMITGNEKLTEHGMYLHASSTAAYWEYWNNIDRYNGTGGDYDNFGAEYNKMTTSIIWGMGHVFSTWFSPAYAHILGIQGLPLNPLVMHIGQHPDYLKDYVTLGLREAGGSKPSMLPPDHWRDIWWNIQSMTDPDAAIADFNSMNYNYDEEAGETKAHTYHWIHSFKALGHLRSGLGDITSNHPATLIFEKQGVLTYVAYNYADQKQLVSFSDGRLLCVEANSFAIAKSNEANFSGSCNNQPDETAPTQPGVLNLTVSHASASLNWAASVDLESGMKHYDLVVYDALGNVVQSLTAQVNNAFVSGLQPETQYSIVVTAQDKAGNISQARSASFVTSEQPVNLPPTIPTDLVAADVQPGQATISWTASTDDNGVDHYVVNVYDGTDVVIAMQTAATSVTLTELSQGTRYDVNVWAVDAEGENSEVASVSLTTPVPPSCTDFCLSEEGTTLLFTVKTGAAVDLHYTVNNGAQQNVRMMATNGEHTYSVLNLQKDDLVKYFFTVIDNPAYDTAWDQHVFGGKPTPPDTQAPTQPGVINATPTHNRVELNWAASSDNVAVDHYEISVSGRGDFISLANSIAIDSLTPETAYSVTVVAVDTSNNVSQQRTVNFTTPKAPVNPPCTDVCAVSLDATTVRVTVQAGGMADIHYTVNNGAQQNLRMQSFGSYHQFDIGNLSSGDSVRYFVTVIDGPAYDTAWFEHIHN